jgi:hypothetical protein
LFVEAWLVGWFVGWVGLVWLACFGLAW